MTPGLPAAASCLAIRTAPATAPPDECPTRMPSLVASFSLTSQASSVEMGRMPSSSSRVVDLRDDAAGHVLQPLQAVQGIVGLDRVHLDLLAVVLQAPAGAHHRAAGADAGDEVGDPAAGLLPDLPAGGLVVPARVGLVAVLVGVEVAVGILGDDLPAQPDGAVRSLQVAGEHQLGAERLADLAPGPGHVGRQHQRDLVAQRPADQRVGDAGVAAGGVDDLLVPGQPARGDGVLDHPVGGAILHRPARVHELALGPDLDVR